MLNFSAFHFENTKYNITGSVFVGFQRHIVLFLHVQDDLHI